MSEPGTTKEGGMPEAGQACENTDRHLWPLVSKPDDPYESIHVTKEGNIGINVCGNVLVMPLREWHRRAGGAPGRALGDEQRPSKDLVSRITAYLSGGGLFNPELANHELVRDLLIECRDALTAPEPCALPTDHPGGLYKVEIAECGCTVLNGVAWHHYCRSISDRNRELEAENARLRAAQPPRDGG